MRGGKGLAVEGQTEHRRGEGRGGAGQFGGLVDGESEILAPLAYPSLFELFSTRERERERERESERESERGMEREREREREKGGKSLWDCIIEGGIEGGSFLERSVQQDSTLAPSEERTKGKDEHARVLQGGGGGGVVVEEDKEGRDWTEGRWVRVAGLQEAWMREEWMWRRVIQREGVIKEGKRERLSLVGPSHNARWACMTSWLLSRAH